MSDATASESTATEPNKRGMRKTRVGVVVSNKGKQTIVVEVVRRVPHAKFSKIVKLTTKLHAHDEKEEAVIGDKVRVMETRPISKLKCWRLIEILAH